MKKIVLILVSALAAVALVSCSTSVPQKISKLADKVEAKGDRYSLDDWKKAANKMEKLVLQFSDSYDSYKISEKAEVAKAVARFTAKAVKCGAGEVLEAIDFSKISSEFLDGANDLIKGAKGFLEGLGL